MCQSYIDTLYKNQQTQLTTEVHYKISFFKSHINIIKDVIQIIVEY